MKNILRHAWPIFCMALLTLPLQTFAQKVWDNDSGDSQWCNAANWGLNLNQAEDIQPGVNDPANLANRDTANTNIYLSCDTTVQQIQLRANSLTARVIKIGTNEVVDRTLGLSGTSTRILANQNLGVGRDLVFDGTTNQFGAKIKLRIDIAQAVEVSAESSSIMVNCELSGDAGFNKTMPGKLFLNASNSYVGPTTLSAGTLIINGSTPATNTITVAGGILGGSGNIGGSVIVSSGTISPGESVGTLTIGGDLTLGGNLFIEVNKSLSVSNDIISVAGALTNSAAGTVTVLNQGPALAPGDRFQVFNQPLPNGEALNVVSASGVTWSNNLAGDGSIIVLTTPPAPVPATNLTITAVGPGSISLGGAGEANSAYKVYASTNVALPMSSWWLLGTTNSDGGGIIQFLDSQATNDQRFYRFGQAIP